MNSTHRTARRAIAFAFVLLSLGLTPTRAAQAQGFKWWQSDRYKMELLLTGDQSKHLEEIFQNALPALRTQKKALDSAEAELERLVQRGDDSAVMAQVAR